MKTSRIFIASLATFVSAAPAPQDAQTATAGGCPAVWTQISKQLTTIFVDGTGQCTDLARLAIRASWHDCGTWSTSQKNTGGCDGSLVLSDEENARDANRGLQPITQVYKVMASQYKVGVADLIAYGGSHATVSCPLGPTTKAMIGRKDSSNAAPDENLLPSSASLSSDEILRLMADKGFSPAEVVALVGAHSTARQRFTDPTKAGQSEDSTPGIWDVAFYGQTANPPANVFVFQSDKNLMNDARSGPTFKSFVNNQVEWNKAFAATYPKLLTLGVDTAGMVDCTSTLPPPRDSFPGANPSNTGAAPAMPTYPGGGGGGRPGFPGRPGAGAGGAGGAGGPGGAGGAGGPSGPFGGKGGGGFPGFPGRPGR